MKETTYTLFEIAREIRMAAYDEKTDQELYRLDPESKKEDSASIIIPVEGAKVKVSSEVENLGTIFSETTISDSTPETVVVNFGGEEISDLSGEGAKDIVFTAAKDLVIR